MGLPPISNAQPTVLRVNVSKKTAQTHTNSIVYFLWRKRNSAWPLWRRPARRRHSSWHMVSSGRGGSRQFFPPWELCLWVRIRTSQKSPFNTGSSNNFYVSVTIWPHSETSWKVGKMEKILISRFKLFLGIIKGIWRFIVSSCFPF